MRIFNDVITSRSNPAVKWAASLLTKKGREENRAFIVEGKKLVFEAAENGLPITHVFVEESRRGEYEPGIKSAFSGKTCGNCDVIFLSSGAFEKISSEKSPEGIISVVKYLDFFRELDIIYNEDFFISDKERAIILSSVRDPGNLGAIIRSAAAFGFNRIVLSADTADVYNPKTLRSAMGGLFKVKVDYVSSLTGAINAIKKTGRRVFAAELSASAKSLFDSGIKNTDVFVIGNEGHGIAPEISAVCNGSVYIPISQNTESLNAAVAASILMWEQSKA